MATRSLSALVGDDGEVVVRAGIARIDRHRALQQIAGVRDAAGGLLHQREVHHRFDVARLGGQRDAELGGGVVGPIRRMNATPRLLCALTYLGSIAIAR